MVQKPAPAGDRLISLPSIRSSLPLKKLKAYPTYLLLEGATSLSLSIAFTFNLVYQAQVAHLSPLQLVLVGTSLETAIFLFEIPTGVVADVYSRRLSIIIGFFLMGAGFALEGSLPVFPAIALGQAILGIGYTFTSGAVQAWISDEIGEAAAGKAFLRGSQVGMAAGLAGIMISTLLADMRINLPIQVGGLAMFPLGFFLALWMPETGFKPARKEECNTWENMAHTFRSGLEMLNKRPALYTILGIGLFYGLYSEAYDRLWVKLILDNFSFPAFGLLKPESWFGVINAIGMLFGVIAAEIVRRRLDTGSHRSIARLLLAASAGLTASLLVFALSGNLLLALGANWSVGVLRTMISPVFDAWVNQKLDPSVRATVLSMSAQVDAIGQIAGGPALGAVGNLVSVRAAITAAALVLSPVLLLYNRALRLPVERDQPARHSRATTARE
jgi:DHA3 family tetracycline resistance protein-like MFS transporter